jgi:hypothetical protein
MEKDQQHSTPSENESAEQAAVVKKSRFRLWIPLTIGALAAARVIRVWTLPETDGMARNMQTALTIAVSLVLLAIWWLFLTRLRWRTRLVWFGLAAIGACRRFCRDRQAASRLALDAAQKR